MFSPITKVPFSHPFYIKSVRDAPHYSSVCKELNSRVLIQVPDLNEAKSS